ncbi:MAG TPA: polysaccharide deacetylase family protein [Clostridiaceae bacterium]
MKIKKYIIILNVFVVCLAGAFILYNDKSKANNDKSKPNTNISKPNKEKIELLEFEIGDRRLKEKKEAHNNLEGVKVPDMIPMIYNDRSIPVLMYHHIAPNTNNDGTCVSPEKFREDMRFLKDNGYYTLNLNELYNFYYTNTPLPEKAVAITFDDGYEDNYSVAYPILKEYGLKATIFMITGKIDQPSYLTTKQLILLDKDGIDIQAHTITHPQFLMKESYERQLQEMKGPKETLETLLSKKISYLAYPYGVVNVNIDSNTVKATKEAGYKMAFTTGGRWAGKEDGLLTLDRVFISPTHSFNVFKERVTNPQYSQTR